jgi:hypothetical protein
MVGTLQQVRTDTGTEDALSAHYPLLSLRPRAASGYSCRNSNTSATAESSNVH